MTTCPFLTCERQNICAVLALGSWNYRSEGQQQSNISTRLYSLPYTAEQCIYKIKIKSCHLMFNSPCNKLAHRGFHFLLFSKAIQVQHWGEHVGLSGLALQSNDSNCLVLIPYRQLGKDLLSTRGSYDLTSQHICKTISQYFTLTNPLTNH